MTYQANQTSQSRKTIRAVCAGAAVFASLTMAASIDLLSRHYGETAQAAAPVQAVTIARN